MEKYVALDYWEKRAPHWIAGSYEEETWWEKISPYVKKEWKVLELGCGTGRWAPYFNDYTGSDVSPTLLAHAARTYPDKAFRLHDMAKGVGGDWDLLFTYTSWLHLSPDEIARVRLPDCNYLFVEPHGKGNGWHCHRHDYGALFGCERLERIGKLTLWGRIK